MVKIINRKNNGVVNIMDIYSGIISLLEKIDNKLKNVEDLETIEKVIDVLYRVRGEVNRRIKLYNNKAAPLRLEKVFYE